MTKQKALVAVRQAIRAAGTTDLAAVSLALEDLTEQMIVNWKTSERLPEKSIKAKAFVWIKNAGIKTTGDLERIIGEVKCFNELARDLPI